MKSQRPLSTSEMRLLAEKRKTLILRQEEFKDGLPFLYGHKWYFWQRAFFESAVPMRLYSCANQVGKSVVHLWDKINRSTNLELWETLWPGRKPDLFWYWMTDELTIDREFNIKWLRWLPQGDFKNSRQYGWKVDGKEKNGRWHEVKGIIFNSGVYLQFLAFAKSTINVQSATVWDMGCFPAGTPVSTPNGPAPIESLKVGDLVMSSSGPQRVENVMRRQADVISRSFSNGETVTATGNHPFWTENRGWIPFEELRNTDVCSMFTGWNRTKKSFCLKAFCITAIRKIRMFGRETTSREAKANEDRQRAFTSLSGKDITTESYQSVTSFITRTSTHSTIASRIFSFSALKNTLAFTSERSGKNEASTNAPANDVARSSKLEALRRVFASALCLVVESTKHVLVSFAPQRLKPGSTTVLVSDVHVLSNAVIPLESKVEVINLTVADSHTYFAHGILVHNCDEEMPVKFWDEAYQRLSATGGYFSAAFTATLNQPMWWRALEGEGASEMFTDALKMQIGKRDCLVFDDGSPGLYTEEEIQKQEKACSSEAQKLRRIEGKFAPESGRKYHAFDPTKHYVEPKTIPADWFRYSAVDVGSGDSGEKKKRKNHPAAFYFVAVRPDFRLGYVYKGRRLDDEQTTAGDVYNSYVVERSSDQMTVEKYDYHSKDFRIISDRNSESFVEADKNHARGEEVVNTLFQNDMLFLFDTPEIRKVGEEMLTLMRDTDKRSAVDDACFSGDTLIATETGLRKIEDVLVGDRVLTRFGWRPVTAKSVRKGFTRLYRCGKRHVRSTENHRFFDGTSFRSIGSFDKQDQFEELRLWNYVKSLRPKSSPSTASNSGAIQHPLWRLLGTVLQMASLSIQQTARRFGLMLKFRTSFANIAASLSVPRSCTASLASAQTPASLLGDDMRVWMKRNVCVNFVGANSRRTSTQRPQTALPNALSVKGSGRTEPVFNLTVGEHHEYFANGILVANCDCVRYATVDIPWDWTMIQGKAPDSTQKKVRRALTEEEQHAEELKQRGSLDDEEQREDWGFTEEIAFWNEQMEGT